MLKLVRNSLAEKKSLVDGQGNFIKWEYVERLHKLQLQEGLHLGNKLSSKWFERKVNINLVTQLLSESVAASLEFCLDEQLSEFAGCKATIKFITVFNKLFDVLNSRNLFFSSFRSPLERKNADEVTGFLREAETYIRTETCRWPASDEIQSQDRLSWFSYVHLLCAESV